MLFMFLLRLASLLAFHTVPDTPSIAARPKYAYSSNKLLSIIISFSESVSWP